MQSILAHLFKFRLGIKVKVFVVTQEYQGDVTIYQVYEDEKQCYEACAGFAERYPESDWSYTPIETIKTKAVKKSYASGLTGAKINSMFVEAYHRISNKGEV